MLANLLWTYESNAWLPHGTVKDGFQSDHPIWLTDSDENPINARMIVLTDGMVSEDIGDYERCLDLFDGNSPDATAAARARWVTAKDAGHELHYWQQTSSGWKEKEV